MAGRLFQIKHEAFAARSYTTLRSQSLSQFMLYCLYSWQNVKNYITFTMRVAKPSCKLQAGVWADYLYGKGKVIPLEAQCGPEGG